MAKAGKDNLAKGSKVRMPVEPPKIKAKPTIIVNVPSNPAPAEARESTERERKYRAEDALRDIERAEKHKNDKDLMRDVKGLAKEKIKALGNIK